MGMRIPILLSIVPVPGVSPSPVPIGGFARCDYFVGLQDLCLRAGYRTILAACRRLVICPVRPSERCRSELATWRVTVARRLLCVDIRPTSVFVSARTVPSAWYWWRLCAFLSLICGKGYASFSVEGLSTTTYLFLGRTTTSYRYKASAHFEVRTAATPWPRRWGSRTLRSDFVIGVSVPALLRLPIAHSRFLWMPCSIIIALLTPWTRVHVNTTHIPLQRTGTAEDFVLCPCKCLSTLVAGHEHVSLFVVVNTSTGGGRAIGRTIWI
jgi:hypothetical protein